MISSVVKNIILCMSINANKVYTLKPETYSGIYAFHLFSVHSAHTTDDFFSDWHFFDIHNSAFSSDTKETEVNV